MIQITNNFFFKFLLTFLMFESNWTHFWTSISQCERKGVIESTPDKLSKLQFLQAKQDLILDGKKQARLKRHVGKYCQEIYPFICLFQTQLFSSKIGPYSKFPISIHLPTWHRVVLNFLRDKPYTFQHPVWWAHSLRCSKSHFHRGLSVKVNKFSISMQIFYILQKVSQLMYMQK